MSTRFSGNQITFENGNKLMESGVSSPDVRFDGVDDVQVTTTDGFTGPIYHEGNMSIPTNCLKGQVLRPTQDNTLNLKNDGLVFRARFADNPTDLNNLLTTGTSFADVFNTWGRFAHEKSTESQPSRSSEINSWTYNSSTDQVVQPVNTVSHTGFYSLKSYNNYFHEARLSSNGADNDRITVVVAFTIDDTGREHTLSVVRNNDGAGFAYMLCYNFFRSDEWRIEIRDDMIPRAWPNNWNNYPTGTLVKVRRDFDIVTCQSTLMGSDTYVAGSLITLDLSSDSRLYKFRQKCPYGYGSRSQPNTTFSDITFTDYGSSAAGTYVFDLLNDKVYVPNNDGSYTLDPNKSLSSEVGPGFLLKDTDTGKLWFVDDREVYQMKLGGYSWPINM